MPPSAIEAALAHARAHPLSYAVRELIAPDGRRLVVVGEAHLKLRAASEIGKELVLAFPLRGVERAPIRRLFLGGLLKVVIEVPRVAIRLASLGAVKGSTIVDALRAPSGVTFELESVSAVPLGLHVASAYLSLFFLTAFAVPFVSWGWLLGLEGLFKRHLFALIPALFLQRWRGAWLIHPFVAILADRNRTMAEGTEAMMRGHHYPMALVIMGRAHLAGYARELVERYGYREVRATA